MELDRNGLEVLDRNACLALLATARLGRIGITAGALPVVLPVNFAFDGTRILIRTAAGTTLDAATRNTVVAFEVDDVDDETRAGWSVTVTGLASEVSDAGDDLERWPGGGDRVVAQAPELVTGRRILGR